MIFKQRAYTLKSSGLRLRPVHGLLLGLSVSAFAIPLAANWNVTGTPAYDGIAERGLVAAERPFDRLLSGEALGGSRLTDPTIVSEIMRTRETPRPAPQATPPALPQATITTDPLPPIIEENGDANVIKTPPPAPAIADDTTAPAARQITAADALAMPFPRQKPVRVATITPPTPAKPISLPPLEPIKLVIPDDSIALNLPVEAPEPAQIAKASPIKPDTPTATGPKIAIVLAAAGLNTTATKSAITRLPQSVTLAFAPIGEQTLSLSKQAASDGHLVLAEVPMEPMNALRDPGEPLTLRVSNTGQENISRLRNALKRVSNAKGVSSYLGARFSRSGTAATPVINAIKNDGYFLFENQPNHQSQLATLAQDAGLPYAAGRIVIDANQDQIDTALDALEAQAKRDGIAIGVGATYTNTVDALAKWMKSAESRGITFVAVTEVADKS